MTKKVLQKYLRHKIEDRKVGNNSNNVKSAMYHWAVNLSCDKLHNSRFSKPAITRRNNTLNIDEAAKPKIDKSIQSN